MYIGDTTDGSGLHNMIYEIVYNSINEALSGFADRIDVIFNRDGSCTVRDNGRGIPTDLHPILAVSAAEVIMTQLHAGGKFSQTAYDVPGRLGGVGVSVINALSEWLDLRIWRNGKEHHMRFTYGESIAPLAVVREVKEMRGTEITFSPIKDIFADVSFDFARIDHRLRELAAHATGTTIALRDERSDQTREAVYRY